MRQRHCLPIISAILAIMPVLHGCSQDAQDKVEAWESQKRTAFQLFRDRKSDESVVAYRRAIALAEQIDPNGMEVATTFNELANVYRSRDDEQNAAKAYEKVILILETRDQKQNLQPDAMRNLCDALEGLAKIKHKDGDIDGAEMLYAKAVRLTGLCDNSVAKQQSLVSEYKSVLIAKGKVEQARALDGQFKHLEGAAALPNPQDEIRRQSDMHFREAIRFDLAGDLPQADREYREAMLAAAKSDDLKFRAGAAVKVVLFLVKTNRAPQAEPLALQALSDYKTAGAKPAELCPLLLTLSTVQLKQGKYKKAEKAAQLALKYAEQSFDPNSNQMAECLSGMVAVYTAQQQFDKAIPLFERTFRIHHTTSAVDSPPVVMHTCWLANLYWLAGKKDKSRELVNKQLAELTAMKNANSVLAGRLFTDFGLQCVKDGNSDEAMMFFQSALKVLKGAPGAAQEIQRANAEIKAAQTRRAT
jgi:tetratricopeptide (TPR) repeat protein